MNTQIVANSRFVFHNVGQWLFYTGEICFNNYHVFRFVYDCGTESKKELINNSIDSFKDNLLCRNNLSKELDRNCRKKPTINLLVISHLHNDHVNGLEKLFEHFCIEEVVIPYFSPLERLLIAIRDLRVPKWYLDFLYDPAEFLIKKWVKKVIVISNDWDTISKREININGNFNKDEIFNIDKLKNSKFEEKILKNEERLKKFGDKVVIKSFSWYALVFGLWIFKFFNYRVSDNNALDSFKRCIEKEIGNKDLKEVIKNKNFLKEKLKPCYKKLVKKGGLKEFNNTSLVFYHSPIGKYEILEKYSFIKYNFIKYICDQFDSFVQLYCYFCFLCYTYKLCRYYFEDCFYKYLSHKFDIKDICWKYLRYLDDCIYKFIDKKYPYIFWQMLTWDINLNFRSEEIKSYYKQFWDKVLIFQVPHHWSIENWNRQLVNDKLRNTLFFPMSAGLKNRYRHPSMDLIIDILRMRKFPIWINEIFDMEIRWKIKWNL